MTSSREVKHTWLDAFVEDIDELVSVWPRVLVPEADDVAKLVDDDPKLVTVFSDRNGLRPIASPAYIRTATGKKININRGKKGKDTEKVRKREMKRKRERKK